LWSVPIARAARCFTPDLFSSGSRLFLPGIASFWRESSNQKIYFADFAGAAVVEGAALVAGIGAGFTGVVVEVADPAVAEAGAAFVGAGVAGAATGCVSSCKMGEPCLLISAEFE